MRRRAATAGKLLSRDDQLENTRIDTTYRLRGEGFLLHTVKQIRDPNPAGEDLVWAEMYKDFLRP